MKSRLLQFILAAACLILNQRLLAEDPALPEPAGQSQSLSVRPPEQLDQLFGPIALYPDALIALILPAATVPSDVVLAARYVSNNGDPAKADDESWDDSVKALVHYPDVIKWMDENLAWTKQAGEAFASQPADVMNSIQRLRARAKAAGSLVDTPQQQVVMEDDNITIIPAQPDVIYVPSYDPDVVYVSRSGYYSDPFLTFGLGYSTGFWLSGYDFDWGRRRIWTVDRRDRERYWHDHHDWRRPTFPGRPGYVDQHFHQQPWRPRPNYQNPRPPGRGPRPEVIRPVPFSNDGPNRPHGGDRGSDGRSRDRGQHRDSDTRGPTPNRRPDEVRTSSGNVVPAANTITPAANNGRVQTTNPPAQRPQRENGNRDFRGPDNRQAQPNPAVVQSRAAPSPQQPQSVPPARAQAPVAVQSAPSQPSPAPASGRAQITTPAPQQPQRDRGTRGQDRREAQSSQPVPQSRVATSQSVAPTRPQQPAVASSRVQSAPTQQPRSAQSSPPAKVDRDDRQDRPTR